MFHLRIVFVMTSLLAWGCGGSYIGTGLSHGMPGLAPARMIG